MPDRASEKPRSQGQLDGRAHSRELFWTTLGRLILLYFVPLLLLSVFFHLQYRHLVRESLQAHLEVIAEHQAYTFDLFLRERLVNLRSIIGDPRFHVEPQDADLGVFLSSLKQTSDAFVDLAVVTGAGELASYAGPVQYAEPVNYAGEGWFQELVTRPTQAVLTEVYHGFRDQPHFTLAIQRGEGDDRTVLRSALSPERLAEYLTTLEGANEVHAAVVNAQGVLQVATPRVGEALTESPFAPPRTPKRGFVADRRAKGGPPEYAYAWLSETPWALVVTDATRRQTTRWSVLTDTFTLVTFASFLLMGIVILIRTRQVVGSRLAAERQQAELSGQLVHAAKLASVGELAAGIAHEINNPLAIIAEEVGVMKDALDPELAEEDDEPLDLPEHLDAIHDAVFRCRDITRKLLTFVRQTEVELDLHPIDRILDEVLDDMLGNELAMANIQVVRRYDSLLPEIITDRNQLIQVVVNLVTNARDAMPTGGTLTVTTGREGEKVSIAFQDTGTGMTKEHMERVFMPFFSTKEPGKGTGLGLSVSNSIIQGFGGSFFVESAPGAGSTFTVVLPLAAD